MFEQLKQVALAIIAWAQEKGFAPSRLSGLKKTLDKGGKNERVLQGADAIANVLKLDPKLVGVVCDGIADTLKAGHPDEGYWEKGSSQRKAMTTVLKNRAVDLEKDNDELDDDRHENNVPKVPEATLRKWVALACRRFHYSENNEFSLHEKNVEPIVTKAIGWFKDKAVTVDEVRDWVFEEARKGSEKDQFTREAHRLLKDRNYKLVWAKKDGPVIKDDPTNGVITGRTFTALVNAAQYDTEYAEDRKQGVSAVLAMVFDDDGWAPRSKPPAGADHDEDGEGDLDDLNGDSDDI